MDDKTEKRNFLNTRLILSQHIPFILSANSEATTAVDG